MDGIAPLGRGWHRGRRREQQQQRARCQALHSEHADITNTIYSEISLEVV